MKKLYNHELAEIQIPAGSALSKFNFPDMPNLKGSQTWGIQAFSVDQIAKAPISGNPLLSTANIQTNCFITLCNEAGKELLKDMPVIMFNSIRSDLSTSTNQAETDAKNLVGQKINWNKSYIRFATAPAPVAASSFILSISYTLPSDVKKSVVKTRVNLQPAKKTGQ